MRAGKTRPRKRGLKALANPAATRELNEQANQPAKGLNEPPDQPVKELRERANRPVKELCERANRSART